MSCWVKLCEAAPLALGFFIDFLAVLAAMERIPAHPWTGNVGWFGWTAGQRPCFIRLALLWTDELMMKLDASAGSAEPEREKGHELTVVDNDWPIWLNESPQTSSHQSPQKIGQPVRFRRGFTTMISFDTFGCLNFLRMSIKSLSHLYPLVPSCPIMSHHVSSPLNLQTF